MSCDSLLYQATRGGHLSNLWCHRRRCHRYVCMLARIFLVNSTRFVVFLLVAATMVFSVLHPTSYLPSLIPGGNSSGEDSSVKIIEFATPLYLNFSWSEHLGEAFDLTSCPESRCRFVFYPERHPKPDAKVFQALHFNPPYIPKKRTARQIMIWLNLEAPGMHPEKTKLFKNLNLGHGLGNSRFFNMTMTFLQRSDVTLSYGHFKSLLGEPFGPIPALLNTSGPTFRSYVKALEDKEVLRKALREDGWEALWKRPRMAAWLVSHCETDSGREFYIQELHKHLRVDMMGKCGKYQCGEAMNEECYQKELRVKYKFYLAFENNMCDDYITEKPYRALMHGMVPVVFGGANYSQYLPPGSYIDATPLKPEALAKVMLEATSSPETYGRFHLWRRFWKVGLFAPLCELCDKLHRPPLHHDSPLLLHDFQQQHPSPSPLAPSTSAQDLIKSSSREDPPSALPSLQSSNTSLLPPSSSSSSSSSSFPSSSSSSPSPTQPQHLNSSQGLSSSRSSSSFMDLLLRPFFAVHREDANSSSSSLGGLLHRPLFPKRNRTLRTSTPASGGEKKTQTTLWGWWLSENKCYTLYPEDQYKRPHSDNYVIQLNLGPFGSYFQYLLKGSLKE
ncbi:alpha-(1,3)-fucosyltransferase C-like [Oratosquilla oratoria]|uniref:alpha-(1,3)-fucosyltransferase C-like n=1 Tax=Oratosquilla oratoria TaxID=337810 RepID=UPI003F775B02